MLQYLRLIAIYGFILFCLIFIAVASHAGDMLLQSPAAVSVTVDGECRCTNNGKIWLCRKAIDFSTPIQCNANLNFQLICPLEKKELCTYSNQPTCTEPRTINVCYPGDEPK